MGICIGKTGKKEIKLACENESFYGIFDEWRKV